MFHYVLAGITALFGLFPIVHLVIGIAALTGVIKEDNGQPLPMFFGVVFIVAALMFMLPAWALAIAVLLAARRLKMQVSYTYCLIVAGIECVFMPFGTILGVFTILVLMRPSVKTLFGITPAATPPLDPKAS